MGGSRFCSTITNGPEPPDTLHKGSTSFVDKHQAIYSVPTFLKRDKFIFKRGRAGDITL